MDSPPDRWKFPVTPWSLIRKAALTGAPASQEALARLCESYWYPLYAFTRRSGHRRENAEDLVQGFFARFIENDPLGKVDPEEGRFRSYLLGALKHHLANEADRVGARKRGERMTVPLALDFEDGERRYSAEPADNVTPEHVYERKWALAFLGNVVAKLGAEYEEQGKSQLFAHLVAFLPGARDSVTYREAAQRTGLGSDAVKSAIHRLRHRYGELLRFEVARTVTSPEDVDDELRYLLRALER